MEQDLGPWRTSSRWPGAWAVKAKSRSVWPRGLQGKGAFSKRRVRLERNDRHQPSCNFLIRGKGMCFFLRLGAEYILFSSACRTSFMIDHMLRHKIILSKYEKIEIIPCIFAYLVWNDKSITVKKLEIVTNMWKLNSTFLNTNWTKRKSKGKRGS